MLRQSTKLWHGPNWYLSVSLFRFVKYSSLLFFFGKYKVKLFKIVAVLLFAFVTSFLYGDVSAYLTGQHPDTLIYALVAKILIVYGALVFVLWQFKPPREAATPGKGNPEVPVAASVRERALGIPQDRLSALADLDRHDRLKSRAESMLK